jgi:hypothetical protein
MIRRLLLPSLPALVLVIFLLSNRPTTGQTPTDAGDILPLPPITGTDSRLGVCYGFYPDPSGSNERPYLDLMYDAGMRHDRWDFSWWAIQPDNQDQWNWSGHEQIVQAENAKGIHVLGILQWTPQWASTYSGLAGWLDYLYSVAVLPPRFYAHTHSPLTPDGPAPFNSFPPRNLDRPVFVNGEINRDNYWGYYVYNIARHFDGSTPDLRVDTWEIWNEVEGAYFWTGTPQDYCQLLQVAYKAVKGEAGATGGNPNAKVLFAGLHYWADPTLYTQVLDCLAAADPGGAQYNYFYDVMSVHFYSRSDNTYDMVRLIKQEMTARGMGDHPIWLTETGAPLYGDASPGGQVLDKGDYYLSIDEAAAYTLQSYANALAAGVDRYYFFRAHDADMFEPHGLIRNDRSLRPAYLAYQVAATYLKGENQVTRVLTGDGVRVSLWGTPRGKVSVLWNRSSNPATYTLEAAMPTATIVDRRGTTQTISATDGTYTLPLPAATANLVSNPSDYIVGGDPLIVIETDVVSPTSALLPLPAVTQGTAITLTWTTSDTGSGIWYTEVQQSTSPTGSWQTIAGYPLTRGTTQTVTYAAHDQTSYYRARARDRVGNWEPWPAQFEVSTTVDVDTDLYWAIDALFNDSNRNGQWDRAGIGSLSPEITLTQVSMRFSDETWHTITATVGGGWAFTRTLLPGTYHFVAEWQGPDGAEWTYRQDLDLDGRVDPLHSPGTNVIGLLRRGDVYLPLLLAGAN